MRSRFCRGLWSAIFALAILPAKFAPAQNLPSHISDGHPPYRIIYPEQRQIQYRGPIQFFPAPLPPTAPPPTVMNPPTGDQRYFALDDAIRTSLGNMRVVRVLGGGGLISIASVGGGGANVVSTSVVGAGNSGRTIYDVAATNTTIDQALGRFDPFVQVNNNWDYIDQPQAAFNPLTGATSITGQPIDQYRLFTGVTKNNPLGGQWNLGVNVLDQRFPHSILPPTLQPLNPQSAANASLSYTQPLLAGAGIRANLAPVLIARINTELSFFQLKDAVQQNVKDCVAAYWNLVAARTTAWARRRQVEQAQFAFDQADARLQANLGNQGDWAQAKTSLAQFRAQVIAADAAVLQQEGALRNLLGLPPWDEGQIIPTTEPIFERVRPDWYDLVDLAAIRRPDLIELKLVLEADQQQLIIANNQALPQLNGLALYRWNGLEGEMPNGSGVIQSAPGQFADWTLGVNFSVPVGLRAARATLRQRELLIARDRANLQQGLHATSHTLATSLRSLDQAYAQYIAFNEAREAAEENIRVQLQTFQASLVNYLPVLTAISDWGNAIISEAAAVANYNTLLADLEQQTGTILESHGVRFYEERYGSIGPLHNLVPYPQSTPPTPNYDRYSLGDRPAEQAFKLIDPAAAQEGPSRRLEELPRPSERPPEVPTPPGRAPVPPPPRPYELPPPPPGPQVR
jgi:outer membrane protein TolC